MTDATTPVLEGLERLASRLALLTSEEGEADNAGRAAGQLARRLGLSGGQLKAIFLAGVRAAGVPIPPSDVAPDPEALGRLESEAADLRQLLDRTDAERVAAQQRVAQLQDENEALRDALDRARVTGRVFRVAALVVLVAAFGGGAFVLYGPEWRVHDTTPPPGSTLQRMARAGASGASLFRLPDRGAEPIGRLPAGTLVPVRQLLWRGFAQWVETEAGGQVAYAPATEIDLR